MQKQTVLFVYALNYDAIINTSTGRFLQLCAVFFVCAGIHGEHACVCVCVCMDHNAIFVHKYVINFTRYMLIITPRSTTIIILIYNVFKTFRFLLYHWRNSKQVSENYLPTEIA